MDRLSPSRLKPRLGHLRLKPHRSDASPQRQMAEPGVYSRADQIGSSRARAISLLLGPQVAAPAGRRATNKILLMLTAGMVVIQLARPRGDGPLVIDVASPQIRLDSVSRSAIQHYKYYNRTWKGVLVNMMAQPPIVVEHRIGGIWFEHRRFRDTCPERPVRNNWRPNEDYVNHGDTCSGLFGLTVPGRFRVRIVERINGERFNGSVTGPEFTVTN